MRLASTLRVVGVIGALAGAFTGCTLLLDADPQFDDATGSTATQVSATGSGGATTDATSVSAGGGSGATTSTGSGGGSDCGFANGLCTLCEGQTWSTSFVDQKYLELCVGPDLVPWSHVDDDLVVQPPAQTGYWEGKAPATRLFLRTRSAFAAAARVQVTYDGVDEYQVGGILTRLATQGDPTSSGSDRWAKWEVGDVEHPSFSPALLGGWIIPGTGSEQFYKTAGTFPQSSPVEAAVGVFRTGADLRFFHAAGPTYTNWTPVLTGDYVGTAAATGVTGFIGELEVGLFAADWENLGTAPTMTFRYFGVTSFSDSTPNQTECQMAIADIANNVGP